MHADIKLLKDNHSDYEARVSNEAHVARNTINSVYTNGTISKEDVERLGAFLRSYLNVQSNPEFDIIKKDIYNLLRNTNFDNVPRGFLPSWIQNESVENANKICPKEFYWTGLLLHMYGFNDLEYLNYGGESVVWSDKKNGCVYKVIRVENELYKKNNDRIHSLHESCNANRKDVKYLSDVISIDSGLITRCKLQTSYIENSKDFYENFYKPQTKNLEYLDQFLQYAKNIVKALIELHSKGYSFNDLKPENLLLEKKDVELFKNKYGNLPLNSYNSKDGELYRDPDNKFILNKYRITLTDYGSLTSLNNEYLPEERKVGITDQYILPGDVLKQSISVGRYSSGEMESAAKRDIYAMGVTLIYMLFKMQYDYPEYDNVVNDIKDCAKYQYSHNVKSVIDSYWDTWLKHVYSPNEEQRAKKILDLIVEMLSEDPYGRPDYHKVLERLKEIQNMNS